MWIGPRGQKEAASVVRFRGLPGEAQAGAFGRRFIGLGPPIADIVTIEDGDEALGGIAIADEVVGDLSSIGHGPAGGVEEVNSAGGLVDGERADGFGIDAAEVELGGAGELDNAADIERLTEEVLESVGQSGEIIIGDRGVPWAGEGSVVEWGEVEVKRFGFGRPGRDEGIECLPIEQGFGFRATADGKERGGIEELDLLGIRGRDKLEEAVGDRFVQPDVVVAAGHDIGLDVDLASGAAAEARQGGSLDHRREIERHAAEQGVVRGNPETAGDGVGLAADGHGDGAGHGADVVAEGEQKAGKVIHRFTADELELRAYGGDEALV